MPKEAGRLVPNAQFVFQAMPTGAVLMNMSSGDCFELNAVGTEIWKEIEKGAGDDVIAADLADRYAIPLGQAVTDVETLIQALVRQGILRPGS